MKYSQKRLTLFARLAIVGGIFLGLFLLGYYTGFFRENCKNDVGCFEQRAIECRPSDVVVVQDNNVYRYTVGRSLWDCQIHVTLERVKTGAPLEFQALEGKKMTCTIPKRELEGFSLAGFDKYFDYCHGLLKEGLYELVLTRVYSTFIGQMDDVLREAEKALKE